MEKKGALCMTVEERRHHADLAEESCHVGSPVNCLEISWLLKKLKIRRDPTKSPFLEEKNGGGKKMLRRTDPEKNGNRLVQELEPYRGRPKPKYLDLGMHR